MKIIQLTPGSGGSFYCENCLRDNELVRAQRGLGHDTLMVPLYLPILGEDYDPAQGTPVFFGGINVYLQQKSALFRWAPRWFDRLLDSRWLLRWAARKAGMTRAADLGSTTISMLRGEHGRQAKELDKLVEWLAAEEKPDIVSLSNALLVGLARRIKDALGVPVACELQGEHSFLDALSEPERGEAWDTMEDRCQDIDVFIASSNFYREYMMERLGLQPERVKVIYNGVALDRYVPAEAPPDPPVLGYLARMSRGEGLDVLAEALIEIKGHARFKDLKLRAAGGKTADDDDFINKVQKRLAANGLSGDVEILPNLEGEEKLAFLRTLSVLSVPSTVGEAFGLFVFEALAMGVPVVVPRHGAFTELVEATGGGVLCEPDDVGSLARALEKLLADPQGAREMGMRGREVIRERFTVEHTAQKTVRVFEKTVKNGSAHD